jgi:gluconate 2-dehydrogenase gamma chain
MSEPDRREALKIIGAIGATCAFPFSADELYAQHQHPAGTVQQIQPAAAPYQPKFFSESEYKLVARMADLIIPPTDTPGAAAAGVPEYIDRVVSANPEQQKRFREGLEWLGKAAGGSFLELGGPRQIELLTPLCEAADAGAAKHAGARFFLSMKNLTADGYYTSREGLVRELGYNGNTVLPEFPECGRA